EAERFIFEGALSKSGLGWSNRNAAQVGEAIMTLTQVLEQHDQTNLPCLKARSFLFGQQGKWNAATRDLFRSFQLLNPVPTPFTPFILGPLFVETGDSAGYANFRRKLLIAYYEFKDPPTAAQTALGLLLKPTESVL